MIIKFHKIFDKRYQRLHRKIQDQVDGALSKFSKNPFDAALHNHALKGHMEGKRAFSVTGDVRIIFEEENGYYTVIMLDVGTHNQVYR